MTERQREFLKVMKKADDPLGAGEIFRRAFPNAPYRGRRDAGATKTLDGMEGRGWVDGRYPTSFTMHATSRNWRITEDGLRALAAEVIS